MYDERASNPVSAVPGGNPECRDHKWAAGREAGMNHGPTGAAVEWARAHRPRRSIDRRRGFDIRVVLGLVLAGASTLAAQPTTTASADPPVASPHAQPTVSYLTLQTDPENCLSCHRFRGLSRLEPNTGEMRLFFCNVEYYTKRQGPHARLRCTACHEAEEVMVIPHQVRTPVDCARACHLVPSSGIEIAFSHQRMHESLQGSAHSDAAIEKLIFDPPLLRPGQSKCLYCHDQPIFRGLGEIPRPTGHGEITSRCEHCHGEQMPSDVLFYANHVTNRLQPARPVRQLAQVCAVCHSDPAILAQIGGHDAVASYLHSFHGKANLLGSDQTATCIDCHASQRGDVHLMIARDDPRSSTHEARLPTTCRTTQCHPGAPPGMSRAAVHLDLNPQARTPEFYVAAFFVAMTAGVMSIFFVLILIDLVNMVLRRHSPEHERLVRLARKLQDHPDGRLRLTRMTPHQRAQHWALALTFILLVATGMPIKFAEHHWAAWLVTVFGGLPTARWIHRVCGVLLMVAFAYHLGYLLIAFIEKVRATRRAGGKASIFSMLMNSPMMINPRDVREFLQLFGYLLFIRRRRPGFGHFNFMQKFEYWAVFWGIPVMGFSGLILWWAAVVSEHVSGRVLNFAFIIHSDEAFLAFIYIAVVHLFSVILTPAIFPVSPGTLTGQVPPEELVEGHLGELEAVAAQLGVKVDDAPHKPGLTGVLRGIVRRTYAIGLFALCGIIGYNSIRFLLMLLFTRQAAPVEIVAIPKRLDARLLTAAAVTPGGHDTEPSFRPRGPLAHFHSIPDWFEADPGNNCTTSGCHPPLPHGKRIEVRAFLNMHSTFVDCQVCHASDARSGGEARWFDLADREPREPPAVLKLAGLLDRPDQLAAMPAERVNETLIPLMRAAVEDSGGNAELSGWLLRLETAYPDSEPWHEIIQDLANPRTGLRTHVHGEYGAKIGLYRNDQLIGLPGPEQREAVRKYLSSSETDSIEQLRATIHKNVEKVGAMCTPCHSPSPTLVDFTRLGYPPARVESLQGSAVVRQVLTIEQGKPFHLPRIAEE